MMEKWQTSCTPNVLGIYLLMRVLENSESIAEVHATITERYERWCDFLSNGKLKHLVANKEVQSYTVVTVTATSSLVQEIKQKAKKEGILLGEGYGAWKPTSFRIANFPAIRAKEIDALMQFLNKL